MKFKMATTAGLSLTLDPMGKMFQNANLIEAELSLIFDLMEKCFKTLLY